MSYVSKMLPVILTVWSVAAQAQTTPYSATVTEDPNSGNYIKTNVVVVPSLVESRFGDKGQWILGGGTNANISGSHERIAGSDPALFSLNEPDALSLSLSTMGGQFVARDFLLGMQGAVGAVINNGTSKTLSTQVGPLAGYNVRINEHASFLPTLAVLYDYSQTWLQNDIGAHSHKIGVEVGLNFSLNIMRHLNVLVGPYVSQSVYNHINTHDANADVGQEGPWATNYGVRASILGWR